MKLLSSGPYFPKSRGPSRVANSPANSWKWAKIELYSYPHFPQVWWIFSQKWNGYHPNNIFLSLRGHQGRVTLMQTDETRPKSNMYKILCLFLLSASLIIWSKMKKLLSDNIFPIICLKETKGQVNSPICPKIKHIQDFMAVPITCKTGEDSIKNKMAIIWTTFSKVYRALKNV